jgi:hypothetical protein
VAGLRHQAGASQSVYAVEIEVFYITGQQASARPVRQEVLVSTSVQGQIRGEL